MQIVTIPSTYMSVYNNIYISIILCMYKLLRQLCFVFDIQREREKEIERESR